MIQQLHQEIADILKNNPFNISKNLIDEYLSFC